MSSDNGKKRVWGEYRAHEHLSFANVGNGILMLVALLPSIVAAAYLFNNCSSGESWDTAWSTSCTLTLKYPIAMVNILFFLNVSVGFWIVGLLQQNFWLIDPYWTLLPPLIVLFYQLNPEATYNVARSAITVALIWVWCARLTFSYFRREEWKFGQREDWRYTKMAQEYPRIWWLLSFCAVGVAQQPMLVGVSLPGFSVHTHDLPLNALDGVAVVVCVAGLLTAYVADTQLYTFMQENARLLQAGQPRVPILKTGLWKYSRHPNYFGETTWWLGYGLFAVRLGQWYMLGGWVLNTAVLLQVTCMTEERMRTNRQGERLRLFQEYRATTSCWIPWWPRSPPAPSSEADKPMLDATQTGSEKA